MSKAWFQFAVAARVFCRSTLQQQRQRERHGDHGHGHQGRGRMLHDAAQGSQQGLGVAGEPGLDPHAPFRPPRRRPRQPGPRAGRCAGRRSDR